MKMETIMSLSPRVTFTEFHLGCMSSKVFLMLNYDNRKFELQFKTFFLYFWHSFSLQIPLEPMVRKLSKP